MIRDRFLTFNGSSYEVSSGCIWLWLPPTAEEASHTPHPPRQTDNTASFTSGWEQTRTGVDSASTYWHGFATPWCEAGIPVQTCESTAGDLLETLKYGCVTSQRDTIDDVPGKHNASPLTPGNGNEVNFLHRWHVGHDRLLMAALAQRPFFDNVWSTPWQNQSTWAGNEETYVELAWVLSVLTAGAVGFGDYPGDSNTTLIMTACRTDGVLLTASLPSYYVDAVYLPAGASALLPTLDPTVGRIYQAPSFVPDSPTAAAAAEEFAAARGNYNLEYFTGASSAPAPAPFLTLLAIDVNASAALPPAALTPSLVPAAVNARAGALPGAPAHVLTYVAVPWAKGFAAVVAACADGAPVSGCAALFSPDAPLAVFTGAPANNFTHNFELWSLAPVYANGCALLGELRKVIRVAPARVRWVAPWGASGLNFSIAGSPYEFVDIAVAMPPAPGGALLSGVVRVWQGVVPSGGVVDVTCQGAGAAAACASVPMMDPPPV